MAVEPIKRREARSGKVSYASPVVLHETSKRRIVVVPFFISRTEGTELAIKIASYEKAPPPNSWALIEERSVSLDETASRKLLNALHSHLAVSSEDADGNYLVIRVSEVLLILASTIRSQLPTP